MDIDDLKPILLILLILLIPIGVFVMAYTPVQRIRLQTIEEGADIAETWISREITFDDDTSQVDTSPTSVISLALRRLQWISKLPKKFTYTVAGVSLPAIITYTPGWTQIFPGEANAVLTAKVGARYYVNDELVWSSDVESGEVIIPRVEVVQWLPFKLTATIQGGERFSLIPNLTIDPTNYLAGKTPGQTVSFTLKITQKWVLWTIGPAYMLWPVIVIGESAAIVNEFHDTVTVPHVDTPTFSLSISPVSVSIGTVATTHLRVNVQVTSFYHYQKRIQFSMQNLPAGLSASFDPDWIQHGEGRWILSSILTLSTSPTAPHGNYSANVVGTGEDGIVQFAALAISVVKTGTDPTVLRLATILTLEVPPTVSPKTTFIIRGVLTDVGGMRIPDASISLEGVGFVFSQAATTDAFGSFAINVLAPEQEGVYGVTAKFSGNQRYLPSSTFATVQVKYSSIIVVIWEVLQRLALWFQSLLPVNLQPYWQVILVLIVGLPILSFLVWYIWSRREMVE